MVGWLLSRVVRLQAVHVLSKLNRLRNRERTRKPEREREREGCTGRKKREGKVFDEGGHIQWQEHRFKVCRKEMRSVHVHLTNSCAKNGSAVLHTQRLDDRFAVFKFKFATFDAKIGKCKKNEASIFNESRFATTTGIALWALNAFDCATPSPWTFAPHPMRSFTTLSLHYSIYSFSITFPTSFLLSTRVLASVWFSSSKKKIIIIK